jgi:hypothetical protein
MGDTWRRPRGSSSVMNQRIEALDSLDDFPTPPWATRALLEHVLIPRRLVSRAVHTCWEPACNRGSMAEPLRQYFKRVITSDIHHYGYDSIDRVEDFLAPYAMRDTADWIITNPPFRLAREFTLRGLELTRLGVAIFARSNWIEGQERYRTLFQARPPALVAPFVERCPLTKGFDEETDERGGVDFDASSATSYSWFVWFAPENPPGRTELVLIPPGQRQALEHADDRRRFGKVRKAPLFEAAE